MPTDSERRRIAARLRADAGTQSMVLDYFGSREASSWRRLLDCLGDPAMDQQDAFARLADLIDPTCEMVVKNGHACCGRCGHRLADECEVEDDYYEFRPFCPDCGARVVSGDAD